MGAVALYRRACTHTKSTLFFLKDEHCIKKAQIVSITRAQSNKNESEERTQPQEEKGKET